MIRFAITSCELVLTKFNRICDVYYYCGVVLSSCNQGTLSCCVVLSLCNVVTLLCGPLLLLSGLDVCGEARSHRDVMITINAS